MPAITGSDQYFTVCPGFPRHVDGYVERPDAPELGLELDEAEIAKYPPLKQTRIRGGRIQGI
jgi:L-alanine-DL-glutamate epimerase-like enolase superfamily enzyme